MKNLLFILLINIALTGILLGQKAETFDIITFKTPTGWQKEVGKDAVQLGVQDSNGGICLITMFKSIPGGNDSKANFDAAWETLVKEMVTVKSAPQMNDSSNENGWTVESGLAQYESDGKKGLVMLITATGNSKMVNVLILTNSDVFQKEIADFLGSINLPANKAAADSTNSRPSPIVNTTENAQFIGSWGKSNAINQLNNRFGSYSYNKQQYIFNSDGTYLFTAKNYSEKSDETLLIRESGTFETRGNSLTVMPAKSVIEAWSKSNGSDNYNKLIKRQNRSLEKTTYQFSIQDGSLLLQTANQTARDGVFSNDNYYRYGPIGTFTPIKLP